MPISQAIRFQILKRKLNFLFWRKILDLPPYIRLSPGSKKKKYFHSKLFFKNFFFLYLEKSKLLNKQRNSCLPLLVQLLRMTESKYSPYPDAERKCLLPLLSVYGTHIKGLYESTQSLGCSQMKDVKSWSWHFKFGLKKKNNPLQGKSKKLLIMLYWFTLLGKI